MTFVMRTLGEGKLLLNKKILLLFFIISLISISVVNATENVVSENKTFIKFENEVDNGATNLKNIENSIEDNTIGQICLIGENELNKNNSGKIISKVNDCLECEKDILSEQNNNDKLNKIYHGANCKIAIQDSDYYDGLLIYFESYNNVTGEVNIYADDSLVFTKQITKTDYIKYGTPYIYISPSTLGLIPDNEYLFKVTFNSYAVQNNAHVWLPKNSKCFNATIDKEDILVYEDLALSLNGFYLRDSVDIYLDKVLFKSVNLVNGGFSEIISNLSAGKHRIQVYTPYNGMYISSFDVTVYPYGGRSLKGLIDNSPNGSIIFLNDDYNGIQSIVNIDKEIIIDGNGHIITSTININHENVVLKNMIVNSLEWNGNNGKIHNCTFLSNIRWSGDYGKIENCSFSNSIAYLEGINLVIKDCNFSESSVDCKGDNGKIESCIFSKSTKTSINIYNTNVSICNSYFFNNTRSNIINIDASNSLLENNYFLKNNYTNIYLSSNAQGCRIKNSYFEKNNPIYVGLIVNYGKFTVVNNCTFIENKGSVVEFKNQNPNTIRPDSQSKCCYIVGSTFINNIVASDTYAIIYICGDDCSVENSILIDCNENKAPMIYSLKDFGASNNWWGNTKGNYSQKPQNVVGEYAENAIKNWLYLDVTISKNEINIGQEVEIIYNFYKYYKNSYNEEEVSLYSSSYFPTFYIETYGINGTIDSEAIISKGRGNIVFTAQKMPQGQLISEYYSFKDIKTFSFVDKGTLYTNDIETEYMVENKIGVMVKNSEGLPVKNVVIELNVNGKTYYNKTNNEGLAQFNINLPSGNYQMIITNNETKETKFNKLIIKSIPIEDNDVVISDLSKSSRESTIIQLPSDASGTITLNIGGKNYEFAVVGGVANVKVPELVNGGYSYIITYSGDGKYSSFSKTGSLTINKPSEQTNPTGPTNPTKPVTKITLTLKKVTVKRSAKKLTIQATLKVNGKSVKNKVIKFKFNKKTYKAKTNAKSVAKITVKKSVLKKLKKGKKVTYTATYGKITKKITVKVKK